MSEQENNSETVVERVNMDVIYPWPRSNDDSVKSEDQGVPPEKIDQLIKEYGQKFHGSEFLDDWPRELNEIREEWGKNPVFRRDIALENGRSNHEYIQEQSKDEFQAEVTLRNEAGERIEVDGHGLRLDGVSIGHNGEVDGKIIREYKTYPVSESEFERIARVTLEGAEQAGWSPERLEIWESEDRSFKALREDHLKALSENTPELEQDDLTEAGKVENGPPEAELETESQLSEHQNEEDCEIQPESEPPESECEFSRGFC